MHFCQEYDILSDHWIIVTGDRPDCVYIVFDKQCILVVRLFIRYHQHEAYCMA